MTVQLLVSCRSGLRAITFVFKISKRIIHELANCSFNEGLCSKKGYDDKLKIDDISLNVFDSV